MEVPGADANLSRTESTEWGNGIMELMQTAGHLSLEFSAVVEGPFTEGDTRSVRVWLDNKRGVSLAHKADRDAAGTFELAVIRESIPGGYVLGDGATPWRLDYSTPFTAESGDPAVRAMGVAPGSDLSTARVALFMLGKLPAIDPRDQRSTRK